MIRLLTILLTISPLIAFGQDLFEGGAQSAGMANASVTLNGPWALFQNQAGLSGIEGVNAGVFYQSRFGLPELSTGGFGIAHPLGDGAVGLSYSRYGQTAFRKQKIGLAYARKLGENLDVGIQFDYIGVSLGGAYGNTAAFTFEGGAIYKANEKITLAVHVFNPVNVQLAEFNDEETPSVLRAGLQYKLSEKVQINSEVRKRIDQDFALAIGIEYMAVENLYLRAGTSGSPSRLAFGIGYKWSQFQIDIAAIHNQTLGYSPQVSLTYNGK